MIANKTQWPNNMGEDVPDNITGGHWEIVYDTPVRARYFPPRETMPTLYGTGENPDFAMFNARPIEEVKR